MELENGGETERRPSTTLCGKRECVGQHEMPKANERLRQQPGIWLRDMECRPTCRAADRIDDTDLLRDGNRQI